MSYALDSIYYDVLVLSACHYSALTWVAYDMILTFPQELEVTRVDLREGLLPPDPLLLPHNSGGISNWKKHTREFRTGMKHCRKWFEFLASGSIIGPLSVDMMLILRLHALYDRNKRLLAFLLTLWITETALILAVSIESLTDMEYIPMPVHLPIPNCKAGDKQNFVKTSYPWIFGLIVQFTFFMLTLYKYIQSIRSFGDYGGKGRSLLQVVRQTKNYAPLVTLFIRDGTFTFLATFVAVFLSLLFFIFLGHTLLGLMGTPWMLAVIAVAASRMYLSLGGYLHRVDDALDDVDCYVEGSGFGLVGFIGPGSPAEGSNSGSQSMMDQRRRTFTREDSLNSLERIQLEASRPSQTPNM